MESNTNSEEEFIERQARKLLAELGAVVSTYSVKAINDSTLIDIYINLVDSYFMSLYNYSRSTELKGKGNKKKRKPELELSL